MFNLRISDENSTKVVYRLLCHPIAVLLNDVGLFVSEFSFAEHSQSTRQQGKRVDNSVSSLPLRPVLQIFRHYPGDYYREFTSSHM